MNKAAIHSSYLVKNAEGNRTENQAEIDNEFMAMNLVVPFQNPVKNSPAVSQAELNLDINIKASAAGIYSITGEELFTKGKARQWPIASLTKLMTAFVAEEVMSFDNRILVTKGAVLTEGTKGNFAPGEEFTVNDLIKTMILVSSNDAAEALASHYNREKFIEKMNKTALDLGMINTVFVDPTGLSAKNLSTIEDLEKLVRFIWFNKPNIFDISRKPNDEITNLRTGERRKLININIFAGRPNFLGGKTGQTPEAEGNLISIFDLNEPKTIIILGTKDRFGETEKILKELESKI